MEPGLRGELRAGDLARFVLLQQVFGYVFDSHVAQCNMRVVLGVGWEFGDAKNNGENLKIFGGGPGRLTQNYTIKIAIRQTRKIPVAYLP